MTLLTLTTSALLVGFVCSASAQTVYRCGPDGREYSQAPCGQSRAVDVSDPRSEAQRAAAQKRARDDEATGRALERERRAREAAAVPSQAGSFSPAATPPKSASARAHKKAAKKKHSSDTDFKAVAPAPAKKPKSSVAFQGGSCGASDSDAGAADCKRRYFAHKLS